MGSGDGTAVRFPDDGTSRRSFHVKSTPAEWQRRYKLVRDRMQERGLSILLIYGAGTFHNQQNLLYFSNYADTLQAYVVFPLQSDPTLLVNGIWHLPNAMEMAPFPDVRWGGARMAQMAAERIRECGNASARIGLVGVDSWREVTMPYRHYQVLRDELPRAEFVEATDLVESVRSIRSEEEIKVLRLGVSLTNGAFEAMRAAVRPGIREFELLAEVNYYVLRNGGRVVASLLGSTAMGDPSMAYPWPNPTDRPIRRGDVILSELSVAVAGYSGQLIRPIFVGEPNHLYQRLFQVAVTVYEGVRTALKPGNTGADVLAVSRLIEESGFTVQAPVLHGWTNRFSPPIIGLTAKHEWHVPTVFQAGQTLMVEPNPSTPDFAAGVFFGDLQLITPDGAEALHQMSLQPIVV